MLFKVDNIGLALFIFVQREHRVAFDNCYQARNGGFSAQRHKAEKSQAPEIGDDLQLSAAVSCNPAQLSSVHTASQSHLL